MSRFPVLSAVALAAALSLASGAAAETPAPPSTHPGSPIYGLATGSDYAVVETGAQAPDFSFESSPGWRRLRDVRAQGHVLLVVAPAEEQLLSLERERARLLSMGVVPMAVLDRRASACRALTARLRLGFTLVPDSRRVIGAQFNAVDGASGVDTPAWFVIDREGRVRDLAHRGWPSRPWSEVCAGALGLPASDTPMPASQRR
jgi:peroxiredoxin